MNIKHILLLFVFTFISISIYAEDNDNIYNISKDLYHYIERSNDPNCKHPYLTVDTMINIANKRGDILAQVVGYDCKAEKHFKLVRNANTIAMMTFLTKQKQLAGTNKAYSPVIISTWQKIILIHIELGNYSIAINEVEKLKQYSSEVHNTCGTAYGDQLAGDTYLKMNDITHSLLCYNRGINQHVDDEDNDGKYLVQLYKNIAIAYMNIGQFKKADDYISKAYSLNKDKEDIWEIDVINLRSTIMKGKKENVDELFERVNNELKSRPTSSIKRMCRFVISDYWIMKQQYEKATEVIEGTYMNSEFYKQRAKIFEAKNNGVSFLNKYRLDPNTENDANQTKLLADYSVFYDNKIIEQGKAELLLKNAQLEAEKASNARKLLESQAKRKDIELANQNLKIKQKETETLNHKLLLNEHKIYDKNQKLELERQRSINGMLAKESQSRKKMLTLSFILVFIIVASFTIHLIYRKRYENKLTLAKEKAEKAEIEAEKANMIKSQFIQNMSHEIRTPLNAIVGFNDILNTEDENIVLSPEERLYYIELVHMNSDLLLCLVNDILDLSKFESGSYKLAITKFSLYTSCISAIESIRTRVAEGVELLTPIADKELMLVSDEQRIRQVIINFLTNACKYTSNGSITLDYKLKDEDRVEISVTDTGSGIPADKAKDIFKRFEKLDAFKQGTGLGLNICKSISDILHGEIYLDTNYTNGCRFVFVVPLEYIQ